MKITADTNVLVRAVVEDDARQARLAESVLSRAELVAVTIPTLCELVWVLSDSYDYSFAEVADVIRRILDTENVALDRSAAEAGLDMLERGGDFADGAIAYKGRLLGGETFVSFDRKAVKQLEALGEPARFIG